ncbi:MAG: lysophospholipid acyltransferase family protein [Bacteroidales bacterium]|nr:lysophospholipid acyltransferase family protein [Candidatus Cryptobacteroides aphodequi]
MIRRIATYLLRVLLFIPGLLPLGVHIALARPLGWLLRKVVRYRVDVVRDNLEKSFPSMDEAARHEVEKRFYRHFAEIFCEAIWFGSCLGPRRLRRSGVVRVVNPEVLAEAAASAPSVVCMYSHAGNWELLGGIASYMPEGCGSILNEGNTCVVYKALSSKVWDDLMKMLRFAPLEDRAGFEGYLEADSLIRYVISHRDAHKFYFINTDQRPYKNARGAVKVNFMNRECASMAAAATIAAKFHFALLYQRMVETQRGHYTIEFVPICSDASQMTPEEAMQRYYALLQADLEAQPHNYLWTHKRWKKSRLQQ